MAFFFTTSDYVTMCCTFLQTVRSTLVAEGASLTQYRILKWLAQHDELGSAELVAKTQCSAATVSKELDKLGKRGFVAGCRGTDRRVRKWRLTGRGLSYYRKCDAVANGAIDAMLSLLTPDLRRLMETSCVSTTIEVDRVATRGSGYDYHSACLETLFEAELTFTKSLHNSELGITDFRVLLELRSNAGATPTDLHDRLLLKKSTVSESLRGLVSAGLVERGVNILDRRSKRLYLTERGQIVSGRLAVRVNDGLTKEIRKTDRRELSSWQELSTMFVVNYRSLVEDWRIC